MRRGLEALLLGVLVLGSSVPGFGDTVWRTNGSKIVGKIVAEEPDRIQVLFRSGGQEARVWIARSDIAYIEIGKTPPEEFEDRLAALGPADLDGHLALIEWAKQNRLLAEAETLRAKLPTIERLARKAKNPTRWCRPCDSVGEVLCGDCKGTGKVLIPCERCDAQGKILCSVCGHREGDGQLRCKRCAGAGEYERFDPAKGRKVKTRCQDCAGRGTHACPGCRGKQSQPCDVCKGEKGTQEPCPTCQGQPKRACQVCKGSGLQPTPVSAEELAREKAAAEAGQQPDGGVPVQPESKPAEGPTTRGGA